MPGFALTKTSDVPDDATVAGGDTITYTVTGTNLGTTLLDSVVITDDMSQVLNNTTLVGTPTSDVGQAPVLNGTTLTWTGSLAGNQVVTLTYSVRVDAGVAPGTLIDNVVSATWAPPGRTPVQTPQISIKQTTTGTPPVPNPPAPPVQNPPLVPPTVTQPLAHTGVDVPTMAISALLLLLLGGTFLLTGTRRRQSSS